MIYEDTDIEGNVFYYNPENMEFRTYKENKDINFYNKSHTYRSFDKIGEDFEIHFTFNTQCNLNCKYCFVNKEHNEHFNFEKQKKVIDKTFEVLNGHISCANISMTGEPLINREEFWKLYEYIWDKGVFTFFITNGTLLDIEKDLPHIQKQRFCVISVDGDKDIQLKHRPAKNNEDYWEKLSDNIKNLEKMVYHQRLLT